MDLLGTETYFYRLLVNSRRIPTEALNSSELARDLRLDAGSRTLWLFLRWFPAGQGGRGLNFTSALVA